jgi:hypothetical protein
MKELWIDPAGPGELSETRIFIFDAGNVSVLERYFKGMDRCAKEEVWIQSVVKENNPGTVYIHMLHPWRVTLSQLIHMRAQYKDVRHLWEKLRQHGYTECQANNLLGVKFR